MTPLAWAVFRSAAARLMRDLDDGLPAARDALRDLFPRTGNAWVIGLTGAPGAGKSSLTDRLIAHHRRAGRTVGVIAVDPTSPFTGGAILGDRIRMQDHALDDGVFIRSVGTRGHLGGLSRSTSELVQVMDLVRQEGLLPLPGAAEWVERLHHNTDFFVEKMIHAGFDIKPTESSICAVMLYDAVLAQRFAKKMLDEGIYVIGFFYPVVPEGKARIRVQVSAAHTHEHLQKAVAAFIKVGRELNVLT